MKNDIRMNHYNKANNIYYLYMFYNVASLSNAETLDANAAVFIETKINLHRQLFTIT